MNCNKEAIQLMHQYLDGDIKKEDEDRLRLHLQTCSDCQRHFHELKRTVALITSHTNLTTSSEFANNVMAQLPKEKKRMSAKRWMRMHPVFTAAAVFFVLMLGSMISAWGQEQELTYPKGKNLVIENDTVIVPEDVTIHDDLEIKNANLKVEGEVKGDVVLINGDHLSASVGKVSGEIKQVDQVFDWLWYKLKGFVQSVFDFSQSDNDNE
ncbi:hypothetical protein J416_02454 [Gracilibacillus halophilus YIM-C55.5]|uniref:Anti-sigma-W factor RsiW n=1 Tax=Gracilibacillus halophilus YIM-C55.5 TaxID=1308866 RepID=N4WCT9_9BACI|nr:anti-sigma factor [Gracilibacillus halophilus]ENH98068.1 hypothetical protein J416_02454 [Gracilibacillus halophilus YIM-C55.5]